MLDRSAIINLKKGNKLYCYKSIYSKDLGNKRHNWFTEGKIYDIIDVSRTYQNNVVTFIDDDGDSNDVYIKDCETYFYSLKKLRLEKIQKIEYENR